MQANLNDMAAMVNAVPEAGHVVFAGLGDAQLGVTASAIALGYGVRVGLEDNIWWDAERLELATNQQLLQRVHELARIHGRAVMRPEALGKVGFYNTQRRVCV